MSEQYQVTRRAKGNRFPQAPTETTGAISGPDAWSMAKRLAERWAADPVNRHVQILHRNQESDNFTLTFIQK